MERTVRLYNAASARGDLAAMSILDGTIDRLCGEPQVYDAVVEQEADDAPIGTIGWYPTGVDAPRCTVPTGIASSPFCDGTRAEHGTVDGPFHAFDASFRELPSTEQWVDSGHGVMVNVGR